MNLGALLTLLLAGAALAAPPASATEEFEIDSREYLALPAPFEPQQRMLMEGSAEWRCIEAQIEIVKAAAMRPEFSRLDIAKVNLNVYAVYKDTVAYPKQKILISKRKGSKGRELTLNFLYQNEDYKAMVCHPVRLDELVARLSKVKPDAKELKRQAVEEEAVEPKQVEPKAELDAGVLVEVSPVEVSKEAK